MRTRRILGIVGRFLIGAGVLILLFVAYQLWGTSISESHSQDRLRQQFDSTLHQERPPASTSPTPAPSAGQPPADGQPVGIIQIPKIGVNKVVVQGTGTEDLHLGPGHYPATPMPGQPGNVAIAGHRTTYGAPFWSLDGLSPGDEIIVTTLQGKFHYSVTRSLVVDPTDVAVVAPTPTPTLTLTTCNPRFSASQRLVVQAALHNTPAPVVAAPTKTASPSGLAGSGGAWLPTLWWGLAALGTGVIFWALARARRRSWIVYVAGAPVMLVVLFFFFENVSTLLPASF
jgi:sortase A